ncbi:MAG: hypothetical protein M0R02_16440, partial [Bacteroidales bacterium]|nr:hypothetical protein [Bacteroidales bacterium]
MNKLTLTSLVVALAMAGCATTDSPPPQPAATVVRADSQPPAEAADDSATAQEPVIYRGNDRVVNIPEARPAVSLSGSGVTLNFEQAPITEVVHSILGEILQLDYIVEHPLKGEVTLRTRAPVPRDQLLAILESLLQSNGALMVRDADDRYIVSASRDLTTLMPGFASAGNAGAGFTNVIFPLRYISASEMARILAPVAPDSSFVRIDNSRNLLVLAGTRNQISGWQEIIATFDIDQLQGMSVGIFPIENSTVEEVGAALNHLLSNEPGGEGVPGAGLASIVRIMPLERLNSILVVTPRAHYLDQMRTWIERLDRSADSSGEATLHVYAVQNGSATHLGQLLSSIFGGGSSGGAAGDTTRERDSGVAPGLSSMSTGSGSGSGGGSAMPDVGGNSGSGGSFAIGDNIRIVADEYNNALLVYAPGREYRKIETALRQLDVMPNQILIEASIIEVTLRDELSYGVEWHLKNSIGDYTGNAMLNLGSGGTIGPQTPGFSYSLANEAGVLRAVINALAEKSLVNVISTPSVMVLDNHTAAIHVGDQQPIRSGQTVSDGGNVSTSIQYKDTGVKLEVTPSSNAGGLVTMSILQSVTDVGPVD